MQEQNAQAKWDLRHGDPDKLPTPAEVLLENRHLLPQRGRALDLACGLGGNALLLAEQGLAVSAWDISPVAIERLQAFADDRGLRNLRAEVRDIERQPFDAESFDVIVVSYYLERGLAPAIMQALRPGGLLFYETFTRIATGDKGPSNPAFRLGDNELLALFSGLTLRVYREEALLGDPAQGSRDIAMLVAQKPQPLADT